MIKITTLLCILLAALFSSPAGATLQVQQLSGFGASTGLGCAAPSVSFLSSQTSTADQSSYTFSDVSIGSATVGAGCVRVIVAFGTCNTISVNSNLDLTIGGTASTAIVETGGARASEFSYLQVDSGTTATFVLSAAGGADVTCERAALMLWRLEVDQDSPRDSGSDTSAVGDFDVLDVDVNNPGVAVAAASTDDTDAGCAWNYTGTDTEVEDADAALEADLTYLGYHVTTTESSTTNDWLDTGCQGSANYNSMAAAASWW